MLSAFVQSGGAGEAAMFNGPVFLLFLHQSNFVEECDWEEGFGADTCLADYDKM